MKKRPSPVSTADNDETCSHMRTLTKLLAEAGYYVFEVCDERRRTASDIIAVKKGKPITPFWIYPSKQGRIIVRPWTHGAASRELSYRDVNRNYRKPLRLVRSSPIAKSTKCGWQDWLSPSSKVEAEHLGLWI